MSLKLTDKKLTSATSSSQPDTSAGSIKEAIKMINSSNIFSSSERVESDSENIQGLQTVINGCRNNSVKMDTDGDGVYEDVNIAQAIADSFDSELDLYIQDQVAEVMNKYGDHFYYGGGFLSEEAQEALAKKGIRVDKLDGRTYTFSLVDENGNVIEDENGNKGSIIFSDCVIPDGYAQGSEVSLSSMLDLMGYECISKADYIGKEGEYKDLMAEVESKLANGEYSASEKTVKDLYAGVSQAKGANSSGVHVNETITSQLINLNTENSEETEVDKRELKREYEERLNRNIEMYKLMNNKDTLTAVENSKVINDTIKELANKYTECNVRYLLNV